jgi:hypothetical protein
VCIQIVAQIVFSSQEFYASKNGLAVDAQAKETNSGEKKWEVIETNFPLALDYSAFLNSWMVIQTAKPTANTAVPMDATSAMIDILKLPFASVIE